MGNDYAGREARITHEKYLREMNITGLKLERIDLDNYDDLVKLKQLMRLYFPNLMATIAEILLYRGEEKLACLLTAYYEINLSGDNIITAVEQKNF